ncbi:hypothetical protein F5H01DRAFT_335428 [Linnemannia elongata]|nr:hypothetical protein F5H01DRAFT_335428 [Linnemannia elongata]
MKITYIALAAIAFAQVCIAGAVLPCTGRQETLCRKFQLGGGDFHLCVCTADVSCQVGMPDCNSVKKQECKDFCAEKVVCPPGYPCPVPSECSNKWMGGAKKVYTCSQYNRG